VVIVSTILSRFCVVYFGLYMLATQIAGGVFITPVFALPALGMVWPLRQITEWTAINVFGATPPLIYVGNSGDTVFHWTQTFLLLTAAAVATAVWAAADKRDRPALYKWFRVFVRFALAAQMFYYGLAKIIPTQFPPPSLVTLVEPVGHLALADMLWTFVGASTPYQIFTGCAEMIAGLLLLVPQTTPLGAVIALADMIQVFILNMTYDFALKQLSFHLILLSLFLLAPDFRRLANVLVLNRPAPAREDPPLFRTTRANRIALVAQLAVGVYLIAIFTNLSLRFWEGPGGPGSPRSPLYGIWDIAALEVDGDVRPPVLNDYDRRWRRVIFDADNVIVFQRTDDSFAHYGVSVDVGRRLVSLTKGNSRIWKATFVYDRPADDRLVLTGEMDGHRIRADLTLVPLDSFRLLNSRFRWVRPPAPYAD
jgi:uncharacterized membrane protein YphA (DoxX/SURF4 family)